MAAKTFLLPDLGEGLTEAEIVRWLVAEGDVVAVDQSVAEVETAKSVVEVPSPYAGRVATLHAAAGTTLAVGQPLISVEVAAPAETGRAGSGNVLIGYGTSGGPATTRRRRPRAAVAVRTAPAAYADPGPRAVPRVISPLVRNLARGNGVDLRTVEATGRGGVITRADVERAIAGLSAPVTAGQVPTVTSDQAAPVASDQVAPVTEDRVAPVTEDRVAPVTEDRVAPVTGDGVALVTGDGVAPVTAVGERRTPLSGFRKAATAALTRSRAEIPEATVWVDVDATNLWRLRESHPDGPGLLAYLARFTVAALREYPVLNARFDAERQEIVEFAHINLGIAVQGHRGLVVPAVIGAEAMTTTRLGEEIRRLTADAREGRVTSEELSAGTFTLNNYGGFGVDGSAAIINHPQVAILGFGRILDRPWVVDGQVCARKITQMSFVFDHRVCDGGTAAGFMRGVADAIEDPASAIARL